MLVNFSKRLPRSLLSERLLAHILDRSAAEMAKLARTETMTPEEAVPAVGKADLLLSCCVTMFELLRAADLLGNMDDRQAASVTDAMLNLARDCFDLDTARALGSEASFGLEICGLQLLFQVASFRRLSRNNLAPVLQQLFSSRVSQVKQYRDSQANPARDVIFLNLACLCLAVSKQLCALVNLEVFAEQAGKVLVADEDLAYHKVVSNLLAVLLMQGALSEDQKSAFKLSMGVKYLDMLAVNASRVIDEQWRGLQNMPLDNTSFVEYWKEMVVRDHLPYFPLFPRGAVQLKL